MPTIEESLPMLKEEVVEMDNGEIDVFDSYRVYVREDSCIRIEIPKNQENYVRISLEPWFFSTISLAFQTWCFKMLRTDSLRKLQTLISNQMIISCGYQNDIHIEILRSKEDTTKYALSNKNLIEEVLEIGYLERLKMKLIFTSNSKNYEIEYEIDVQNEKMRLGDEVIQTDHPQNMKLGIAYYSWSNDRYPFCLSSLAKLALTYANMGLPASAFQIITKYEKHRLNLLEDKKIVEDKVDADIIITKAIGAVFHKLARCYWHRFCIDPTISVPPQLKLENSPYLSSDEIQREIVSYEEIQEETRRHQLKLILALNRKVILALNKLNFRECTIEADDIKYSVLLDSSINFFLVTQRSPPCCSLCRKFSCKNLESGILPQEIFNLDQNLKLVKKYYFCSKCSEKIKSIETNFYKKIWKPFYNNYPIQIENVNNEENEKIEDNEGVIIQFTASIMFKFMMSLMSQRIEEFETEWKMRAALRGMLINEEEGNYEITQFKPTFYFLIGEKNNNELYVENPKFFHSSSCLHIAFRSFHFIMLLNNEKENMWEGFTKLDSKDKNIIKSMKFSNLNDSFKEYYKNLILNEKNQS